MSARLERLRAHVVEVLEDLRGEFSRPGDVRLTFIARCPWLADGDVVVTDDVPREAIEAIRKLDQATAAAPTLDAGGTTR